MHMISDRRRLDHRPLSDKDVIADLKRIETVDAAMQPRRWA
jgi:hypothetical protein